MKFTINAKEADIIKRKIELNKAYNHATKKIKEFQFKLIMENNVSVSTKYKTINIDLQKKINSRLQKMKNSILNEEEQSKHLISNFKQNIINLDEIEIIDKIICWYLFFNKHKKMLSNNVLDEFMNMYEVIYKKQNILNNMIGIKNTKQFIFNMYNLPYRAILCRNIVNID
jgi:hypothetical protein